ncbi:MAG: hypothetical protein ACOYXB_03220 [Bacteroidota bacterium]
MKYRTILLLLLPCISQLNAQLTDLSPESGEKSWQASWIYCPGESEYEPALYLFRNSFTLADIPDQMRVFVTAGKPFILYLNGQPLLSGPAPSDPQHWYYNSIDLKPYLVAGENVLAAELVSIGDAEPATWMSHNNGFILQSEDPDFKTLNTPGNWKVSLFRGIKGSFSGMVPDLTIDTEASAYPWNWKTAGFDDAGWPTPFTGRHGAPAGSSPRIGYALYPAIKERGDFVPVEPEIITDKAETSGGKSNIHSADQPDGTNIRQMVLDCRKTLRGLPVVVLSGGKGSKIRIQTGITGAFNEKDPGAVFTLVPDGGQNREYVLPPAGPFRYIRFSVEKGTTPPELHSLTVLKNRDKARSEASFSCDKPELESAWNESVARAEINSGDLFTDFPTGGRQIAETARQQALASYILTGNPEAGRKCILDFYHSIVPEGLTLGSYPDTDPFIAPTASLDWIAMLYDYLWYVPDEQFVFDMLIPVQNILSWFEYRIDEQSGMVGRIGYGCGEEGSFGRSGISESELTGLDENAGRGNSAALTLRFALSLDQASGLFNYFGYEEIARSYSSLADSLKESTFQLCWNEEKEMMADYPGSEKFCAYTQFLSVLTDAVKKDRQALLTDRTVQSDLTENMSPLLSIYMWNAMLKSGMAQKIPQHGRLYIPSAEDQSSVSAAQIYAFFTGIAGIKPGDYGFKKIIIEPHPGQLGKISARMPFDGEIISMDLDFSQNGGVKGWISLPKKLDGIFVWYGKTQDLKPGKQFISIQNKFK